MKPVAALFAAVVFLLWLFAGIAVAALNRIPLTVPLIVCGVLGAVSAASVVVKWRRH